MRKFALGLLLGALATLWVIETLRRAEEEREAEDYRLFTEFLEERHPTEPLSAEMEESVRQRMTQSNLDHALTEVEFKLWKEQKKDVE